MYFPGDSNMDDRNSIKVNIRDFSFYIKDTYEMKLKIEEEVSMDWLEESINWGFAMDGPNLSAYDTAWENGSVHCLWSLSREIRENAFTDRGKLYQSDIQTFADGVFTVGLRSSDRVLFKGLVQYYTNNWDRTDFPVKKNCIEDFRTFEEYMEDSLAALADDLKNFFRFTRIV